jgi:hypothetical protein
LFLTHLSGTVWQKLSREGNFVAFLSKKPNFCKNSQQPETFDEVLGSHIRDELMQRVTSLRPASSLRCNCSTVSVAHHLMSMGRSKHKADSPLSGGNYTMRSELVFKALAHEPNRYLLVRLVAKGTRRLHRPNTRVQDTTNEMLEYLTASISTAEAMTFEQIPVQQRRAA